MLTWQDFEELVLETCGPEAILQKVYRAWEGDIRVVVFQPSDGSHTRFTVFHDEGGFHLYEMP